MRENIEALRKESLITNGLGFFDGILKGFTALYGDEKLNEERAQVIRKYINAPITEYETATEKLYKMCEDYVANNDNSFVKKLWQEIHIRPQNELENFINQRQIACKKWLIDNLVNCWADFNTVYVLGGWYGALSQLMLTDNRLNIKNAISFDIDEEATQRANRLNSQLFDQGRFVALTEDMISMSYGERQAFGVTVKPDLVINTSFEHISNYQEWLAQIPSGTRLVLQSNNYFDEPTHVNCVDTLNDFANQVNLKELKWKGELDVKRYTRFMIIGEK